MDKKQGTKTEAEMPKSTNGTTIDPTKRKPYVFWYHENGFIELKITLC